MTRNRKPRLEKLWVEFGTIEESERGMNGIYVKCMGPLLHLPQLWYIVEVGMVEGFQWQFT